MSLELKRKDLRNNYHCVGVAYCDLQYLLQYFNKLGYYAGVYGWRGDCYVFDGFAICTGYEPIQTIKIDDAIKRKIIKKYNNKAQNYYSKYTFEKYGVKYYDKIKKQAEKDLQRFLNEIKENIIEY